MYHATFSLYLLQEVIIHSERPCVVYNEEDVLDSDMHKSAYRGIRGWALQLETKSNTRLLISLIR